MLLKYRADRLLKNLCQIIYDNNIHVNVIFKKFDVSGDNNLDLQEFTKILKVVDEKITD